MNHTHRNTDVQADNGKVPPSCPEAEKSILAGLLAELPCLDNAPGLEPRHFYDPANAELFRLLRDLRRSGTPHVKPRAIWEGIKGDVKQWELHDLVLLARDYAGEVQRANIAWHAKLITDAWQQRQAHNLAHRLLSGEDDLESWLVRLDEFREASAPDDGKVSYTLRTWAELDRTDLQLEYLVERTLVAGQPCIMSGKFKAMKSSTGLDLAVSLASGTPFLGALEVYRPANVLFITAELGGYTVKRTMRCIGESRGVEPLEDGLTVCDDVPQLTDPRHLDAIEDAVERSGAEVLILDPVYLMLPGNDAGNVFSQGEKLRPIAELSRRLGLTLILIHHNVKHSAGGDPYEVPELADIAWAGFAEFARQWILVGRRQKYNPDRTGEHKLWVNCGGSAGHSALWGVDIDEGPMEDRRWWVKVRTPDEVRADAQQAKEEIRQQREDSKLEADKRKIVRALVKLPDGETKRMLRDMVGLSTAKMDAAIAALLECGDIEVTNVTKSKGVFEGFKLTDEATEL